MRDLGSEGSKAPVAVEACRDVRVHLGVVVLHKLAKQVTEHGHHVAGRLAPESGGNLGREAAQVAHGGSFGLEPFRQGQGGQRSAAGSDRRNE
eukprot:CAMPEP_0202110606 /NCGR_PEP_ID=MMETSP0965-20130614/27003_1 /ASSEMBLY_ACC=CAM_ASM_000507 /TAXON_ID=4773 /ORGANISM="Schizochytrium aggregatum, Strain ATCC28209" /LENGTH=92 /DNA_ID=CAMNT_0048680033 /DNA_START=15 /DNA_END=290 /DNA_ORIENTATION=+